MRPLIGIIAHRKQSENIFDNQTTFVTNYPKRIFNAGGLGVGVLFSKDKKDRMHEEDLENYYNSILSIYDGFLFVGGSAIKPEQLCALRYAYLHNKPVFGICLGMQTMVGFDFLYQKLGHIPTYREIENGFQIDNDEYFLEKVTGHSIEEKATKKNLVNTLHKVIFKDNPYFKTNKYPSLHNWAIKKDYKFSEKIEVLGKSEDNIVEAIKIKDKFAYGVQFHPEIKGIPFFTDFVKECKNKS